MCMECTVLVILSMFVTELNQIQLPVATTLVESKLDVVMNRDKNLRKQVGHCHES